MSQLMVHPSVIDVKLVAQFNASLAAARCWLKIRCYHGTINAREVMGFEPGTLRLLESVYCQPSSTVKCAFVHRWRSINMSGGPQSMWGADRRSEWWWLEELLVRRIEE